MTIPLTVTPLAPIDDRTERLSAMYIMRRDLPYSCRGIAWRDDTGVLAGLLPEPYRSFMNYPGGVDEGGTTFARWKLDDQRKIHVNGAIEAGRQPASAILIRHHAHILIENDGSPRGFLAIDPDLTAHEQLAEVDAVLSDFTGIFTIND